MATLYKQTAAGVEKLTAELEQLHQKPAGTTATEWKVHATTMITHT